MSIMNQDRTTVIEGLDRQEMSRKDMEPVHGPTFETTDAPESATRVEMHSWHGLHGHMHVNWSQEEYTPQEVALMLGTSLEVVMRATWSGELKARREGRAVVCIPHGSLTSWMAARRRAG